MKDVDQCSQPMIRSLVDYSEELSHIWVSVLVSFRGSGTQQQQCEHFVHGPLGNDRNGWGKRLTVHRMVLPIYLITQLLSFDEHLHET